MSSLIRKETEYEQILYFIGDRLIYKVSKQWWVIPLIPKSYKSIEKKIKQFRNMKIKFNYLMYFFKEIIINNPIKLIFTLISLIAILFLTSFDDYISKYDIIAKTKINNIDYYIYNNDNNKLSISKESEDFVIKNNTLYIYSYNIINILSYIFSILIFFAIIIITFIGDDEWEYSDCKYEAFKSLIRCEYENDKFYYFIGDRLIQTEKYQTSRYNIYKLSELKNCPIYYTKKRLRNNRLNDLNI